MGRKKKLTATPSRSEKPVPYVPTFTATAAGPSLGVEPNYYPPAPSSGLKDSGARTASITGALREPDPPSASGEVRPRYDLIPALERSAIMHAGEVPYESLEDSLNEVLAGNPDDVGCETTRDALAIVGATIVRAMGTNLQAWKRLAIHYARGAVKYADRNWEKGLETGRTVASLMRHLQQAKEGLTDEDHLAATLWNVIALMFTLRKIDDCQLPDALDTYRLSEFR